MENIKALLYTDGSLTEALSVAFDQRIRVDVLREISRPCTAEEIACLHDNNLWQRDVILCADRPLILARTRVGLSKLNGSFAELTSLGNRPLGEWLFRQNNLKKLSFSVDEHKKQRNTVYQIEGVSIWVQEIFI